MVPVHLGNSHLGLRGRLRRVSFLGLWKKKMSHISDVDPREAYLFLAGEIKSEAGQKEAIKGLELKSPQEPTPKFPELSLHHV